MQCDVFMVMVNVVHSYNIEDDRFGDRGYCGPSPRGLSDSRGRVPALSLVWGSVGSAFFRAWNFHARAIRLTWEEGEGGGRGREGGGR